MKRRGGERKKKGKLVAFWYLYLSIVCLLSVAVKWYSSRMSDLYGSNPVDQSVLLVGKRLIALKLQGTRCEDPSFAIPRTSEFGISLSEADIWTLISLNLTGLDRFKEKAKKRK